MSLNSLAATFAAAVSAVVSKVEELSTLTDVLSETGNSTFAFGTGANQADGLYHDEDSLANPAGTVTLDFTDSSLSDKLGEAINFSKLKALYIQNTSVDATLDIGGVGANAMPLFNVNTEILVLQPGGIFVFICADASGLDISTNAKLKLTHGGEGADPVVYQIVALGVQT